MLDVRGIMLSEIKKGKTSMHIQRKRISTVNATQPTVAQLLLYMDKSDRDAFRDALAAERWSNFMDREARKTSRAKEF